MQIHVVPKIDFDYNDGEQDRRAFLEEMYKDLAVLGALEYSIQGNGSAVFLVPDEKVKAFANIVENAGVFTAHLQ